MTDWATTPQPVDSCRWRFPRPSQLPDGDLVTLGADLQPSTVIHAYRVGLFPMEATDLPGVLAWWSPDPRGILPLDGLRVTRSMRQSARRYEIRVDTCFERVIRGCANARRAKALDQRSRSSQRIRGCTSWDGRTASRCSITSGQLAGGLYGVRVDGLFAGESMFHVTRDASKVALMALVDLMRTSGMPLLDVQWCTDHLASLGAIALPRPEYLAMLAGAVQWADAKAHR